MPMMQLISQFVELEKELQEAVRVNDGERIQDVDMQIELRFTQVLDYDPVDAYERLEKCKFLIERLCPADNRHGIDQLICNKIIELVSLEDVVSLTKATAK